MNKLADLKKGFLLYLVLFIVVSHLCPQVCRADSFEFKPVVSGLHEPLCLAHARDGSKRLFVVEKDGIIKIIRGGEIFAKPFLDIRTKTSRGGEQGLLGIAFHPQFPRDPRFFADYTDVNGNTVVSEFRVAAERPEEAVSDSEKILLQIPQPYANHNGGGLQFGPDGKLYIATGDGGSAGDPKGNGQKLDTLLGKMLRVDVNKPGAYSIPEDNPFRNTPGARAEIWAYGLRNPWRFSFDYDTGRLFAGDVGQNRFEEVNIIERGKNYGWNKMEAAHCFKTECDQTDLELPIAEYGRTEGISVTGGYVYRGASIPELKGAYIFGDFGSGTVWQLRETAGKWSRDLLLKTKHQISSFGEDEERELYLIDYSGSVLKLQKKN